MSTINQLNAADSVKAGDLVPVYIQTNGDARKVAMSVIASYINSTLASVDSKNTQYSAPSATGFTVNVTDSSSSVWLVLTPTGTMAAGTIKLPSSSNAVDKQEVLVNSTQAVTSLTVDGNGATAVTGAPTTLAANAFFTVRYDAVTSTWYRVN